MFSYIIEGCKHAEHHSNDCCELCIELILSFNNLIIIFHYWEGKEKKKEGRRGKAGKGMNDLRGG